MRNTLFVISLALINSWFLPAPQLGPPYLASLNFYLKRVSENIIRLIFSRGDLG